VKVLFPSHTAGSFTLKFSSAEKKLLSIVSSPPCQVRDYKEESRGPLYRGACLKICRNRRLQTTSKGMQIGPKVITIRDRGSCPQNGNRTLRNRNYSIIVDYRSDIFRLEISVFGKSQCSTTMAC
jgi:hypothetical protein